MRRKKEESLSSPSLTVNYLFSPFSLPSTKVPSRKESMTEMKNGRKPPISQLDGELFHFHYSFSLFLYLNLLLGVVSVPKEILISKSGVVKTLWIRSDKRKLHTCSSKEKKIGELS